MFRKVIFLLAFLLALNSCGTFFTYPDRYSQKERFQFFHKNHAPLDKPLSIYWDKYSIPFIEAQSDSDLAFGIGLVHAHLRIDQMEFFRYIANGRISEIAGPIPRVKQMDHIIKIINFQKAAKKSIKKMSKESIAWMENFTRGVNWYIAQLEKSPVTSRMTGRKIEPYTMLEVITLSKLVSSDLTWAYYIKYLKFTNKKEYKKIYNIYMQKLKEDTVSFNNNNQSDLTMLIKRFSRSGSNSVVVSGKKTPTGSAMIANDPHVGLFLPNFWLLVGIKSPSYHAIGYMIPGVPIIGIGRNRSIAWGGTNMRGISSHLYDVTDIPEDQIKIRKEKIKRRWWFDTHVEIRETPYGPVLTDSEFFEKEKSSRDASLFWVGQSGSDEIDTFLKISQASNWKQFKSAFKNYKISAMNMTYSDAQGNIGMIAAYGQPILKAPEKTLELIKSPNNPVVKVLSPINHPNPYNPSEGFIGSANNKPFSKPDVPFSYGYSNNDRIDRIKSIISAKKKINMQDLMDLQNDVFNQKAYDIKEQIRNKTQHLSYGKQADLFKIFSDWDGHYYSKSEGALIFNLSMVFLWRHYVDSVYKNDAMKKEMEFYSDWKTYILEWVKGINEKKLHMLVKLSLNESRSIFKKYKNWGGYTQQAQATVFGMIPVIGSRFRLESISVNGSSDTLNKYGRKLSTEKAEVFYGASARHISDLSSIDENYFVMNGGQDSWVWNENINDQIDLWRKGQYIKIPMSMKKVKRHFGVYHQRIYPNKKAE